MTPHEELEAAWSRMERRLRANATHEEHGGVRPGDTRVGGTDAAPAFAGTDLPAALVLAVLASMVKSQLENYMARGAIEVSDLQGLALAAFLFGWESRS